MEKLGADCIVFLTPIWLMLWLLPFNAVVKIGHDTWVIYCLHVFLTLDIGLFVGAYLFDLQRSVWLIKKNTHTHGPSYHCMQNALCFTPHVSALC